VIEIKNMNRLYILRFLLAIFVTVWTYGQNASKAEPAEVNATLPPELARVLTDYETAWSSKDAFALANLFTEDGFVLSPGHPIVRGRAAIVQLYSEAGGMLVLRAMSYATAGDVGYIIGVFTSRSDQPERGKFTLTLHRSQNKRWLIVSDMDN